MRPYSLHTAKRQMQEFYRPSTTATNSLAFSGGNETAVYRLSLSNLDAENIQPNSGYTRRTANLNVKATMSERLTITGMAQYVYDEGRNRPITNYAPGNVNWGVTLLANSVPIEALAPGYYENGFEKEWQHVAIATNPYFVVNKMSNDDSKNRIIAQGSITYNLLPNLFIKSDIMRDLEVWESKYYIPVGTAARPDGQHSERSDELIKTNFQTILGYDTSFRDFSVDGLAGASIERNENNYINLSGIDYILPDFPSFSNLGTTSTDRGVIQSGTNSLFASANFNYKEFVYLNLTGRQDWFSTLNPGNNSIFYPSIGGSFIVSQVFDLPDFISFARIRSSWAQIGAANVAPYAINRTFGLQEGGHLGNPVQGTSSAQVNPDLRPLTSTTREIGFDLDFFDGRFGVDLTLYERKNEDDIISTSLPLSSGATSTILNVGEINNKGIELLLTAEPVRNSNFTWNTSFNLGYNKNEVVELAPGTPEGGTSLLGHPLSMRFERDMAYTEDGTPIYNSVSNYEFDGEFLPMGPGVPPTTMGLSNNFTYKNFNLDILLDAKFGNIIRSRHLQYFHRFGHAKETLPGREDGLTLTGVDENGNPYEYYWPAELMATYYNNQGRYGALFTRDGSFVKLRSLSLTYSIPERIISFANLASADISIVGRNLAILYSETEHFDPEQGFDANDNQQNFAGTQLPRTRNIGLNLNIKF
jgi:outer membrane receptor protein involved in Fe transport